MEDDQKEIIMKVIEGKVTNLTCYKCDSYDGSSTQWEFNAYVKYSEEHPQILLTEVEFQKELDGVYKVSNAKLPCNICSNKKVGIKVKNGCPYFVTAYCSTCKIVYEDSYAELLK